MKHILFSSSLLFAGGTILMSCSSDELFGTRENVKRIEASICDFVMEDGATRTSHTLGDNGYEAVWATGDVLGIYPLGGDQVAFPISDGVGTTLAKFDGGAWALRGTYKYAAYYPFSTDNYTISETAIPVSYLGQTQAANNSVTHFGGYDFMAAAATNPDASGSVTLPFKHLSSYLILPLTLPKAGTYTQLTLTSSNGEFITKGTVDLSAPSPIITATETSSSISMNLDNIVLTADNLVLTANMLIAPVNLTGSTITITVTDSNGATYTNTEKAWTRSAAFVANTTYKASRTLAGSGTGGSIEGGGGMEEDGEEDTTPYLTFKADATQTLRMSKAVATLEYSVNNGDWAELGTNTVTFGGSNGDLRLRGMSATGTGIDIYNYSNIRFGSGNATKVQCSGDIRTLVDYERWSSANTENAKFVGLFAQCPALTTGPDLPSMVLAENCYQFMFASCKSLAVAPTLPATELAPFCYSNMFDACTSLTTAPELPAKKLAESCYECMFAGCRSLVAAPALPATELVSDCYYGLFITCTSLTTAPELPVKKLESGCYAEMFSGCTSLTTAPELPATTLAPYCYTAMFQGCTSLTTAPELPATTLAPYCYRNMFNNTALTVAPELPALKLEEHCYEGMFNCPQLNQITMLATDISAEDCLYGFMESSSLYGTFYKNSKAPTNLIFQIPDSWTMLNKGDVNYVDLGIKNASGKTILWSKTNLGANLPWNFGFSYAWGETKTCLKEFDETNTHNEQNWGSTQRSDRYTWDYYKWCSGSTKYTLTKYNTNSSFGIVDGLTQLESADDAATANFGQGWRMPTLAEMKLLKNKCYFEWSQNYNNTGIAGYVVYKVKVASDAGKTNSDDGVKGTYSLNDTHIFLPWSESSNSTGIDYRMYWTSSLYADEPSRAHCLRIDNWALYLDDLSAASLRCNDNYIRPVFVVE